MSYRHVCLTLPLLFSAFALPLRAADFGSVAEVGHTDFGPADQYFENLLEEQASGTYQREVFMAGAHPVRADERLSLPTDESLGDTGGNLAADGAAPQFALSPSGHEPVGPRAESCIRTKLSQDPACRFSVSGQRIFAPAVLFYHAVRNGYDRYSEESHP